MKVSIYPHKYAVLIENVFTIQECKAMIDMVNKLNKWEKALVGDEIDLETRNCDRLIIDDPAIANTIFERIQSHLPKHFGNRSLKGVNERLRFLKYGVGQYFRQHYDGVYKPDYFEQSYITCQVYLNTVNNGGETVFYNKKSVPISYVKPKAGSVLLFEHHILHSSSVLYEGEKYVIRTDVMYRT